jgi:hypothetical protein
MVNIHYGEKRITSKIVLNQITYVNDKLKRTRRNFKFDYEGVGSPMRWTIWEINKRTKSKQKLISNATNKEVYLYFLGMSIII